MADARYNIWLLVSSAPSSKASVIPTDEYVWEMDGSSMAKDAMRYNGLPAMPAASRNGNSAYAFWDKQHFKNRAVFSSRIRTSFWVSAFWSSACGCFAWVPHGQSSFPASFSVLPVFPVSFSPMPGLRTIRMFSPGRPVSGYPWCPAASGILTVHLPQWLQTAVSSCSELLWTGHGLFRLFRFRFFYRLRRRQFFRFHFLWLFLFFFL